jgi:hypothetical protein
MNENIKLKYGLWIAIIGLITVVVSKININPSTPETTQQQPTQPQININNTNTNNVTIPESKPNNEQSRANNNTPTLNPNRLSEPVKTENNNPSPHIPKPEIKAENTEIKDENPSNAFANLPQQWEGTYKDKTGTCPVVLQLEYHRADLVKGKFDWTSGRGKSITSFEGEIIERPTSFVEESKWKSLDNKLNRKKGVWIKIIETGLIAGVDLGLQGQYYCLLADNGTLTGIWFPKDAANHDGEFKLVKGNQ